VYLLHSKKKWSASFISSSVREWNKLENFVRNLDIPLKFKRALLKNENEINIVPKLFMYGPRKLNVILTQLGGGGIKLCRYCGARPLYILLNNWSFLLGRLLYNGSQPVSKYKESVFVNIGNPVTILAASNCNFSNLFEWHLRKLKFKMNRQNLEKNVFGLCSSHL
jgi:hypothetical protein